MKKLRLFKDNRGATVIEFAFAMPVFILMLWMLIQLALVYRAMSGIQQALGEGARLATLCPAATRAGCTAPTRLQVQQAVQAAVYGIGPGTFTTPLPTCGKEGPVRYYDVSVTYSQPTSMLLFPGPTISVGRSKRVWTSETDINTDTAVTTCS